MPSQQKACLDNQKAGNRRQSRSSHVHVRAKKNLDTSTRKLKYPPSSITSNINSEDTEIEGFAEDLYIAERKNIHDPKYAPSLCNVTRHFARQHRRPVVEGVFRRFIKCWHGDS